jgi:hypothetical protein
MLINVGCRFCEGCVALSLLQSTFCVCLYIRQTGSNFDGKHLDPADFVVNHLGGSRCLIAVQVCIEGPPARLRF